MNREAASRALVEIADAIARGSYSDADGTIALPGSLRVKMELEAKQKDDHTAYEIEVELSWPGSGLAHTHDPEVQAIALFRSTPAAIARRLERLAHLMTRDSFRFLDQRIDLASMQAESFEFEIEYEGDESDGEFEIELRWNA